MPCIRSPPQRRGSTDRAPVASSFQTSVDAHEENEEENNIVSENRAPLSESNGRGFNVGGGGSGLQQAKQKVAAAAAFSKRNGPQITVLPDARTRIWELEGEISKLERDKRFLEEERRKAVEEKDAEIAEMKLQFSQQLDSERRRAQKELEASNAQWREEVEESNARHERREKEFERKLALAKDTIRTDLEAEFSMRMEQLEREKNRLRAQVEVLEADVKDLERYRGRTEEAERELREVKEAHARSLVSMKGSSDSARKELMEAHAQELATAVDAARAETRLQLAREMNEAMEKSRQELRQAHQKSVDSLEAENRALQAKYEAEIQSLHERLRFEQEEKSRFMGDVQVRKDQQFGEAKELREKVKTLMAQNDSLRSQLRQEQEERAKEERKHSVEMEVAQQRTDEAVARALSIVKRTEDKMTMIARSAPMQSSTRGTSMPQEPAFEVVSISRPVPPPPPSRYAASPTAPQPRRTSFPSSLYPPSRMSSSPAPSSNPAMMTMAEPSSSFMGSRAIVPAGPSRPQHQQRSSTPTQRGRASSSGHLPHYLAQTQSSIIRSSTSPTDYDLKGRRFG